jgi:integrase/recombinase XerD
MTSKARLAMALMLYTACRREDAVRLGPQHIKNGRLKYRQAKNEHRANPVDIDIPVHPDLAEILNAEKSGHMTFLITEYGKPFSANGFGNKFRVWCNQAGLRHCSAHGLRKATATRLAERGATPHEIMSITGHKSLEEVERYTREAQRRVLADSAMAKLKR